LNKKTETSPLFDQKNLPLDRLHRLTALTVMALGTLVLVGGWGLGIGFLKSVVPGFPTMKANTSIGFILCGLSLALWRGRSTGALRAARATGAVVAVIGAANLAQYLGGVDLGIDQLLFRDTGSPFTSYPGRMSAGTAVSFLFTGAALALLPLAAAEWLAVAALLPALLAGAAYLHNAMPFAGLLAPTGMAVHTIAGFLLLAPGILTARPGRGVGLWVTSSGPEGSLVRYFLPMGIVMLFCIALFTEMAVQAQLIGSESRDTLDLFLSFLAFGALIFTTARRLARVDAERRRAEQALREGEQRLSLALVASGGGGWEWDLVSGAIWWSTEMYPLWGLPHGLKVDHDSLWHAVHPDDRGRIKVEIAEAIDNDRDFHCEYRVQHPVRGDVWLASHGRARKGETGAPLCVHGITRDVTARKQDEEALRAAYEELELRVNERTRALTEAHVVLKDLNDTLEERIEARTSELVTTNALLQESRSAAFKTMTQALEARKEAEEAGKKLLRSNNRLDFLAQSAKRLLASDSPQELIDELCHDVLSVLDCHLFFHYQLDEESARLHLLESGGIAEEEKKKIEWLDPDASVCGRAVRERRRIIAEDIYNSYDPVTDVARRCGLQSYVCHPLVSRGRVVGTLSFGSRTRRRFEEEQLALLQAVSDQVAIAIERKRGKEELVQAKEAAETASKTKSQFLANMSHELRTPMTGILGMLDLVLEGPLEPAQKDFIKTAHTSGHSLIRILNDILDLTRIQSGVMAVEEKSFSPRECLQRIVNLMLPSAKKKGLEIRLTVPKELPEKVVGDEVRLGQILTNLASNAVKFTDSGSVELAVTYQTSPGIRTAEFTFAVRDTGIGIPREKEAALFGLFDQADYSNTRKYGGAGLGLVICKEIAGKLGGTITFTSEADKGSVFYCNVPLTLPEDTPALEPAATPRGIASGARSLEVASRILVVDDDGVVRQILKTMLEQFDFVVEVAENGKEALEMYENLYFDIILMDVQMPVMDGFAATKAIRSKEEMSGCQRTPIIAVTAHAFEEDEGRCLAAGMDAYLSKPIDFKKTLQLIDRVQQRKAA
jgi:signal transduction histidine kinase/PAS domain-containing protein/ActR/RegA family two-component response regulator